MVENSRLENLFGQNSSYVKSYMQPDGSKVVLHDDVIAAFKGLQRLARTDGINLVSVSSYRSYERQLAIWNDKMSGRQAVLDGNGIPMEHADVSEFELIFAILRWSALPGASRHHWGTDLDVIDRSAVPAEYNIQLVPNEYAEGGVFERLGQWLPEKISENKSYGFFRPYERDLGGVSPEPWHLSFAPVAYGCQQRLTLDLLRQYLERIDILGKQTILSHLDEIFDRFVKVPDTCYPDGCLSFR